MSDSEASRHRWYFEDMLEYAEESISILAQRTLPELEKDRISQLALMRCLEVFGEAANRIPFEHRTQYPGIPWKEAVSTRNRLVHGYDAVRLDIVHSIISQELPNLIPVLKKILSGFSASDS
jgi:uncharacterized protein with HEPN domain